MDSFNHDFALDPDSQDDSSSDAGFLTTELVNPFENPTMADPDADIHDFHSMADPSLAQLYYTPIAGTAPDNHGRMDYSLESDEASQSISPDSSEEVDSNDGDPDYGLKTCFRRPTQTSGESSPSPGPTPRKTTPTSVDTMVLRGHPKNSRHRRRAEKAEAEAKLKESMSRMSLPRAGHPLNGRHRSAVQKKKKHEVPGQLKNCKFLLDKLERVLGQGGGSVFKKELRHVNNSMSGAQEPISDKIVNAFRNAKAVKELKEEEVYFGDAEGDGN